MPLEVLTTEEMARADRAAVALGVASLDLMEAAGRAVANQALHLARRRRAGRPCVAVACGPGNNGGDGFVAARLLAAEGLDVRVGLLGDAAALQGDARVMHARWTGSVATISAALLEGADVVVDALFGAGLSRPLQGEAAAAVEAVNGARRDGGSSVLAVDVPSGLDGSTGWAAGPVVQADQTVTFFRLKPGHLLLPGRRLCGRVTLAQIGIPDAVLEAISPRTWTNDPGVWQVQLPLPALDAHKYARGHAVVVSGPPDSTGAARLGARAALRVGAGLVTLVGSPAATAVNAVHSTAVMVRTAATPPAIAEVFADHRRNAALIGPGAGTGGATIAATLAILGSPAAAVLDADALTAFAPPAPDAAPEHPAGFGFVTRPREMPADAQTLFSAIAARTASVVLTPHEGEFKRLFGNPDGSKLDRARAAAAASGAVVVLKGPDTVIAAPDGRAAINHNAPAWLATAGSGDVLAGFVTGLLAQAMPAFEAACAAVWLHGACGALCGRGLIAEDLAEKLPAVFKELDAALANS